MSDLHEELSILRELQNLVVLFCISTQPDVVFGIDENSMLGTEPFVALGFVAWASPRLKKLSVRIKFQKGWCRNAALRLRRLERGAFLTLGNCRGTVEHPHVVVAVDGETANLSGHPFIRYRLRPERVRLERRYLWPIRL